jgi:hypothetical protein
MRFMIAQHAVPKHEMPIGRVQSPLVAPVQRHSELCC